MLETSYSEKLLCAFLRDLDNKGPAVKRLSLTPYNTPNPKLQLSQVVWGDPLKGTVLKPTFGSLLKRDLIERVHIPKGAPHPKSQVSKTYISAGQTLRRHPELVISVPGRNHLRRIVQAGLTHRFPRFSAEFRQRWLRIQVGQPLQSLTRT